MNSPKTYGGGNSTFTDPRDNQRYRTVQIGNQVWLAENLNYKAGTSKCNGNDKANCQKYGRLYDWKTAKQVCLRGWHLPSRGEWDALDNAVGGASTAGLVLKSKSGWKDNGNGTDEYGFSALPGGKSFLGRFLLSDAVGYGYRLQHFDYLLFHK